jgi:glycosyltransferase involved in cell wall biosynthesis
MREVRDNPTLAQTLITDGRQRVKDMFTKERMVEATLKAYEQALAG